MAGTGRKDILHFPLPARIARLVLSRFPLFAQEFVDITLRWHCAFLHGSRNIHDLRLLRLLLLLLLLVDRRLSLRLRLVMWHWRMIINIHGSRLLLLLGWWRLLILAVRRVLVVQRRVQEIVGAHGGCGPGQEPLRPSNGWQLASPMGAADMSMWVFATDAAVPGTSGHLTLDGGGEQGWWWRARLEGALVQHRPGVAPEYCRGA